MAEYIDRGKILELISCEMEKQKREYAFSDGVHCGLERALGIVKDYPAADIEKIFPIYKWKNRIGAEIIKGVNVMSLE